MNEEQDLIPVLSYARISDDGEGDRHGVTDQHRVNQGTAKRFRLNIVAELTDNDRSASKAEVVREDFERMVRVLRTGKLEDGRLVQGVIVLNDDRLARRAGDYERFVEALTCKEGRVYADERGLKDLYSEDVEGLGLVGVAFSKIESRKTRRRIRRWHLARAIDGKSPGGTRPFGWRADDRTKLHPVESALLGRAVDEFLAGRSGHSIVVSWQKLGILTTLGNVWSAQAFKLMLNNPRLCGWRRLGGQILRDEDANPIIGNWEPITTPEKWLAIHAIIEGRKGKDRFDQPLATDYRDHKYLLTGIARCGKPRPDSLICNARLTVDQSRRGARHHVYVCPPKTNNGCGGIGRRGDLVDQFVTEAVLAKLSEREMTADEPADLGTTSEIANHEKMLMTLRQQWTARVISDGFFFTTVQQVELQLKDLRNIEARQSLQKARGHLDLAAIRERWYTGELDLSQKRAYIREALHAVIIHPGGRGRAIFNPDLLELVWR
jgi:DNA invertase Pin-like site-specific DNA recombinase